MRYMQLIVDLQESFVDFKQTLSSSLVELPQSEATQCCARLFSYMVESAIMRGTAPRMIDANIESSAIFNAALENHFPKIERIVAEWELPNDITRVIVNMETPTKTILRAYLTDSQPFEQKLLDNIINDMAEGVKYPRHIEDMINSEYPNAIRQLQESGGLL